MNIIRNHGLFPTLLDSTDMEAWTYILKLIIDLGGKDAFPEQDQGRIKHFISEFLSVDEHVKKMHRDFYENIENLKRE